MSRETEGSSSSPADRVLALSTEVDELKELLTTQLAALTARLPKGLPTPSAPQTSPAQLHLPYLLRHMHPFKFMALRRQTSQARHHVPDLPRSHTAYCPTSPVRRQVTIPSPSRPQPLGGPWTLGASSKGRALLASSRPRHQLNYPSRPFLPNQEGFFRGITEMDRRDGYKVTTLWNQGNNQEMALAAHFIMQEAFEANDFASAKEDMAVLGHYLRAFYHHRCKRRDFLMECLEYGIHQTTTPASVYRDSSHPYSSPQYQDTNDEMARLCTAAYVKETMRREVAGMLKPSPEKRRPNPGTPHRSRRLADKGASPRNGGDGSRWPPSRAVEEHSASCSILGTAPWRLAVSPSSAKARRPRPSTQSPSASFPLCLARNSDYPLRHCLAEPDCLYPRVYEYLSPNKARELHHQQNFLIYWAFIVTTTKQRLVMIVARQSKLFRPRPVKMENLESFAADLLPQDNLLSFDIEKGYNHFRLYPTMHHWFLFRINGRFFRCVALPFGWRPSLYYFIKFMRPFIPYIRATLRFRVHSYMDDLLVALAPGLEPATTADIIFAKRHLENLLTKCGLQCKVAKDAGTGRNGWTT